ncbi:hypothetical protein F4677DRAFT_450345 [Hypoxylon crocopeplum]|nr:hypothetical protein F4677DRAFT_450345 [Hypoxylon crocopeplum]
MQSFIAARSKFRLNPLDGMEAANFLSTGEALWAAMAPESNDERAETEALQNRVGVLEGQIEYLIKQLLELGIKGPSDQQNIASKQDEPSSTQSVSERPRKRPRGPEHGVPAPFQASPASGGPSLAPGQPFPTPGRSFLASGRPLPASGKPPPASGKPSPAPGQPFPAPGRPFPASGKPPPASGKPFPASGRPFPAPIRYNPYPAPPPPPPPRPARPPAPPPATNWNPFRHS